MRIAFLDPLDAPAEDMASQFLSDYASVEAQQHSFGLL